MLYRGGDAGVFGSVGYATSQSSAGKREAEWMGVDDVQLSPAGAVKLRWTPVAAGFTEAVCNHSVPSFIIGGKTHSAVYPCEKVKKEPHT
jgi:hypothetical protein